MFECPDCGEQFQDPLPQCPHDGSRLVRLPPDGRVGQVVGSYVLTRCLGRGGMGTVYQAEHPGIGSRVAVKFLHPRHAGDPVLVERFFNEARAVNLIGHDNVVKVLDFATAPDGSPYFVMEFLEGRQLTALCGRPQPLSELGPVWLQVAEGLAAAHQRGIIHRDLKPDNILLVTRQRRRNVVKILDFGIAKVTSPGGSSRTRTGLVMGTAQYMSPEQAGGEGGRIGPASDIYALGVMMFQLATGRLPFDKPGLGELLVAHMVHPPPRPRDLVPSIPEPFEKIILRCLAKKPEERFGSMTELYEAMGALLDAHGMEREVAAHPVGGLPEPDADKTLLVASSPVRKELETTRLHQPDRRNTWRFAAGAAAVSAVGLGGWLWSRPGPKPEATVIPAAAAPIAMPPVAPAPTVATPTPVPTSAPPAAAVTPAPAADPVQKALERRPPEPRPAVSKPRAESRPEPVVRREVREKEPRPSPPRKAPAAPREVGDGIVDVDL